MTKRIKPHPTFTVSRPDEIAETMTGVTVDLYTALWELVPLYKNKRTPEEMEEPCYGTDSLSKFWSKLTPEHQAKLNELAKAQDDEWNHRRTK